MNTIPNQMGIVQKAESQVAIIIGGTQHVREMCEFEHLQTTNVKVELHTIYITHITI